MLWRDGDAMLETIIAAVIILTIVGLAIGYIIRQRKKGMKCIGCPDSKICNGCCSGCGKK